MPLLTLFWLHFSSYEGKQRGFLRCAFRGYALLKVVAVGFVILIFVKNYNIIYLGFKWIF